MSLYYAGEWTHPTRCQLLAQIISLSFLSGHWTGNVLNIVLMSLGPRMVNISHNLKPGSSITFLRSFQVKLIWHHARIFEQQGTSVSSHSIHSWPFFFLSSFCSCPSCRVSLCCFTPLASSTSLQVRNWGLVKLQSLPSQLKAAWQLSSHPIPTLSMLLYTGKSLGSMRGDSCTVLDRVTWTAA